MLKIRNSQLASLNALVSARLLLAHAQSAHADAAAALGAAKLRSAIDEVVRLSLIHISEPTRPY